MARFRASAERPRHRHMLKTPPQAADAYDLATKARKTLPGDPKLAELLGRLSYQKKKISHGPFNYSRKPLGSGRLMPILLVLPGNVSAASQAKRPKRAGLLVKLWPAGSRNLSPAEAKRALAVLQAELKTHSFRTKPPSHTARS